MGWFSAQEIVEAKRVGTVGDMMGYDFIDVHGKPARTLPLTPPESANVSAYAADMAACLSSIVPALSGWDPGFPVSAGEAVDSAAQA